MSNFEAVKLVTIGGHFIGWTRVRRIRPCMDILDIDGILFRFRDVKLGHLEYRGASVEHLRGPWHATPPSAEDLR